jgi:hypothetical protein
LAFQIGGAGKYVYRNSGIDFDECRNESLVSTNGAFQIKGNYRYLLSMDRKKAISVFLILKNSLDYPYLQNFAFTFAVQDERCSIIY